MRRELYFQYHDFAGVLCFDRFLCFGGPFIHPVDPELHGQPAVEDTELLDVGLLNLARGLSCVDLALEPGWSVLLLVVGEVIPCSLLSFAFLSCGGVCGLMFSGRIDLFFPHWQFSTKVDGLDLCWGRGSLGLLIFQGRSRQVLIAMELVFR